MVLFGHFSGGMKPEGRGEITNEQVINQTLSLAWLWGPCTLCVLLYFIAGATEALCPASLYTTALVAFPHIKKWYSPFPEGLKDRSSPSQCLIRTGKPSLHRALHISGTSILQVQWSWALAGDRDTYTCF